MALDDTFVRLDIDTVNNTKIAAMSDIAKQTLAMHISAGNSAFRAIVANENQAAQINGLGGYVGRMQPDNMSIVIGANRPFYLPLLSLAEINVSAVAEIFMLMQKRALTATMVNRGRAAGNGEWKNNFLLTAEEIQQAVVYPRTVWENVVVAATAPAASPNNFLYLPLPIASQLLIQAEDEDATGSPITITIYYYDSTSNTVGIIDTLDAIDSNSLQKLDIPPYPFILPVATTVVGGTWNIRVGIQLNRYGG